MTAIDRRQPVVQATPAGFVAFARQLVALAIVGAILACVVVAFLAVCLIYLANAIS